MRNIYFPFSWRNQGFYAALELVKRGKWKIVGWGFYRWLGIYIDTEEDDKYIKEHLNE